MKFELHSKVHPAGDQPTAIAGLLKGLKKDYRDQTLLGVTGSGKTFTMANIIAKEQRPTLVLAHNKTLAAQLASEFRELFPKNAVHYFVSYYDYYQPEAYIARTDTYIAKETSINEEIDKLRYAATASLLTRRDVIIVASVSCIYGLGSPVEYNKIKVTVKKGQQKKRREVLLDLININYNRNDINFTRGMIRVRGDVLEIYPVYEDNVIRIGFFGDTIESITKLDGLTGELIEKLDEIAIFPASHYATSKERVEKARSLIRAELEERVAELRAQNNILAAERLLQRVNYDLEMLEQVGYVSGIENYSRFIDGRSAGEPPSVLVDYFPKDFLMFIDESHKTVPQIGGMYEGDRARKRALIDFGFRLPSALDNRPLKFSEFDKKIKNVIYVSATPGPYELKKSKQIVEQIIRPTGLLDPTIEVRKTEHQIDDLLGEIKKRTAKGQRVLVTTLTKRMAEDLTDYLEEAKVKVQYLHADVETFKRLEILRDLRLGEYDVVVGINLLREGLDLPEVTLVAILDADKESFLRDEISLIQTMGRAARHVEGHVIMYADRMTGSMRAAIHETQRRRKIQEAYNTKHGITPLTIVKAIREDRLSGSKKVEEEPLPDKIEKEKLPELIKTLEEKMELAAQNLEFERAAELRDQIAMLKDKRKGKLL